MSTPLIIPAGERGQVRLFTLAMDTDEATTLVRKPQGTGEIERRTGLIALFGLPGIDPDYVDVLELEMLQGVGLISYLADGNDIDPADLAKDHDRLSVLQGWVLVVLSPAFAGQAIEMQIDPRLRLIGTYAQRGFDWSAQPIEISGAAPRAPKSEARIGSMVAMAALLFLAVFVTLLVLLSG